LLSDFEYSQNNKNAVQTGQRVSQKLQRDSTENLRLMWSLGIPTIIKQNSSSNIFSPKNYGCSTVLKQPIHKNRN